MKKNKTRLSQGIYLLPNFFTSVNLFLGFYAIIMILKAYTLQKLSFYELAKYPSNNYKTAAWAIIIATIFDTLDGRVARMTKTTSAFGLEYDSLADLTTFGMAPALLLYSWSLGYFDKLGWGLIYFDKVGGLGQIVAFLYFACVALRLARFNVQSKTVEKEGFQGMPSPAGAGFIAAIILMNPVFLPAMKNERLYILILPVLLALLMVSSVPYRNFKEIDFEKRFSFPVVLLIVLLIIVFYHWPVPMVFAIFTAYASSGVLERILSIFFRKKGWTTGLRSIVSSS